MFLLKNMETYPLIITKYPPNLFHQNKQRDWTQVITLEGPLAINVPHYLILWNISSRPYLSG